MAAGLLQPQPCPSQSIPRKAHLKHEIMLLQPVLLRLLGLVAPLNWVATVLSQLCSHLPQLILMRTQLLLLQRQVLACEVPLSECRRGAARIYFTKGKLRPGQGHQINGVEPGSGPKGVLFHLPSFLPALVSISSPSYSPASLRGETLTLLCVHLHSLTQTHNHPDTTPHMRTGSRGSLTSTTLGSI